MKHQVPIEVVSYQKHHIKYLSELRLLAHVNRRNPTPTEKILWQQVLSRRQTGYLFLRQKPLGKYIADFYCSKLRLIIEVDGGSHYNKQNLDKTRDGYFTIRKIRTLRFTDSEIIGHLPWVKEQINKFISTPLL